MKKKNLVIVALASAAFAIAGGAALTSGMFSSKATGVEASSSGLFLRGDMNNWEARSAFEFTTSSDAGYTYELKDITLNAGVEWKIADSSWGSSNFDFGKINFVGNEGYFSGSNGSNVKTDAGGVYDFYIKDVSNDSITLKVVNQAAVDPVAITQWDIVGSFNNWGKDPGTPVAMPLAGDYYTATVDFETGVEFQILGNSSWAYSLGTQWVSKINNSSVLTEGSNKNAYVVYAGTFTFKISKDVTDVIFAGGNISNYIQVTYSPKAFAVDTVYLTAPSGWGTSLYAYAYKDDGASKNANWPGVAMTKVSTNEYGQDVYSVSGISGFVNIIFNNNSGKQTVDGDAASFGENNACWIAENPSDGKYPFGGYYTYSTDRATLIEWAIAFDGAEDLCNGEDDEWSTFVTSYAALAPAAKAYFTTAEVTANADGNTLERAAYRYERGVAVKNQNAFAEGQRPKTGFQANYAAALKLSHAENKSNVTAIAVTAAIGVGAAVGIVFLRRRRVL